MIFYNKWTKKQTFLASLISIALFVGFELSTGSIVSTSLAPHFTEAKIVSERLDLKIFLGNIPSDPDKSSHFMYLFFSPPLPIECSFLQPWSTVHSLIWMS